MSIQLAPCTDCGKPIQQRRRKTSRPPRCHPCSRARWTAKCENCGDEFISKRSKGGWTRFCSRSCATKFNAVNRPTRPPRPSQLLTPCPTCGASFIARMMKSGYGSTATRQRQRYCSRPCAAQARRDELKRNKPAPQQPESCAVRFGQCSICRSWFSAKGRQIYCGTECGKTAAIWSAHLRSARQGMPTTVDCGACGETIKAAKPGTRWCASCKPGPGSSHRKRSRLYGGDYEPVNPRKVYERDGWKCNVCGERVLKKPGSQKVPHGWSLDHVIPLSLGGDHTYANTACCHWLCNSKKGIRAVNEQLALIG